MVLSDVAHEENLEEFGVKVSRRRVESLLVVERPEDVGLGAVLEGSEKVDWRGSVVERMMLRDEEGDVPSLATTTR